MDTSRKNVDAIIIYLCASDNTLLLIYLDIFKDPALIFTFPFFLTQFKVFFDIEIGGKPAGNDYKLHYYCPYLIIDYLLIMYFYCS